MGNSSLLVFLQQISDPWDHCADQQQVWVTEPDISSKLGFYNLNFLTCGWLDLCQASSLSRILFHKLRSCEWLNMPLVWQIIPGLSPH